MNARLDQWDAPRSTPLCWAAWTQYMDVDGRHAWGERSREELVRFLLDSGADPNIVAGDAGLLPCGRLLVGELASPG